jgi:WD40 repeat protein
MVRRRLIGRFRQIVARAAMLAMLVGPLMSRVPAMAGDPPTEPILRLGTGMQTATIRRISVDAAGRLLLTVSDDKTAYLWSLSDGHRVRVLRPPIGTGAEGKLYAGALSPDGRIAAVGGWTGWDWDASASVYLFDTSSGRLLRRLSGLPGAIDSLAVSPDGQFLGAGLSGNNGIRVWRTSDWTLAWDDRAYLNSVYGLSFSKFDELVTSSDDGFLRLYDQRGQLKHQKVKAPGGADPLGVAFSPEGTQVAVGYDDSNRVDVLSGDDLRLLWSPDLKGINGQMAIVVWSKDGKTLLAGDRAYDEQHRLFIRAWSDGGKGAYRDVSAAQNTIMGLAALPGDDLAFASYEPTWGVMRSAGLIDLLHVAEIADYRDSGDGAIS